jgi:hypothetical protein
MAFSPNMDEEDEEEEPLSFEHLLGEMKEKEKP